MTAPLSRVSLNQATAETTGTEELVAACVEAGIGLVGLWRHRYVRGDATLTRKVLDAHGVGVSSLCRGGFFTAGDPDDDNRRAVEEAVTLGAPVLVLVCGPVLDGDVAGAQARIEDGVERLLPFAADAGVTLAVEPFHPMLAAERSAIVTLAQALDVVERFDHPRLGIALDSYHVWWDPQLYAGIVRAGSRLAAVHIADWLVPTTDLLRGRGLPGDGVIDLRGLLHAVTTTGYTGPIEVEVLNPDVWAKPVDELLPDIVTRMAALLEDAR